MAGSTRKTVHVDAAEAPRSPDDLVTAEDFLAWCDEDSHAEWIGGKIQMVSPASTNHRLEGARCATALAADAGVYESPTVAGFRLDIEWLWQEPLPLALDVLRELGAV